MLIAGIALIAISHDKWEHIIGKLVGVSDLEISSGAMVVRRIIGAVFILLALWLTYTLFF
ncbi:hypothetical protein [Rubellicoccus peritrichatus]|uniref:Uncharacterized protein n=1 Tax=Rubellicoccus peritrichatus TaxID=3080537 RepID=A0AAQ3LCW9_9BACT|nr:hypothetical protein [Puniceicoccus sp. CR14]WOO42157.1 hypothetical protein RZN69_03585 [Puniceicoccus sp. CR14]